MGFQRLRGSLLAGERDHLGVLNGHPSRLPNYRGPRPAGDDFIPQPGTVDQLDGPTDAKFRAGFRQSMLLNGVDLPGTGLFLTAEHTAADVDTTVAAVAAAVELVG